MAKKKIETLREEIEDFLGYVPIRPASDAALISEMAAKRIVDIRRDCKRDFGRAKGEWEKGLIYGLDLAIREIRRGSKIH